MFPGFGRKHVELEELDQILDDGNQPNSEAERRPGVEDDHTTSGAEPAAAKPGTTAVLSTCANLGKLVVDQAKTPTVLMGTIGAVAGGIIAGPLGAAAGMKGTAACVAGSASLGVFGERVYHQGPKALMDTLGVLRLPSSSAKGNHKD